jgi:ribA/ribD-fused uncharacterized protein
MSGKTKNTHTTDKSKDGSVDAVLNGPDEYVFFWKKDEAFGEFCQWYESPLEVDGIEFNCAEQFMMYKKAMLFGDDDVANQILVTTDPLQQKKLGQLVQNFDQSVWNAQREAIVTEGNLAKFGKNAELKKVLFPSSSLTMFFSTLPTYIVIYFALTLSGHFRNRQKVSCGGFSNGQDLGYWHGSCSSFSHTATQMEGGQLTWEMPHGCSGSIASATLDPCEIYFYSHKSTLVANFCHKFESLST